MVLTSGAAAGAGEEVGGTDREKCRDSEAGGRGHNAGEERVAAGRSCPRQVLCDYVHSHDSCIYCGSVPQTAFLESDARVILERDARVILEGDARVILEGDAGVILEGDA